MTEVGQEAPEFLKRIADKRDTNNFSFNEPSSLSISNNLKKLNINEKEFKITEQIITGNNLNNNKIFENKSDNLLTNLNIINANLPSNNVMKAKSTNEKPVTSLNQSLLINDPKEKSLIENQLNLWEQSDDESNS